MASVWERVYEATLDLSFAQGYQATSVEELLARAAVSRADFERLFGSKEACAIAVFEHFRAGFDDEVRAAYEAETRWPASLRAAAYAVARWMVAHPREVRFGGVEMLWAGEMAQTHREATFQSFVDMIDAGREQLEDPDSVPSIAAERAVGAIAELAARRFQHSNVGIYELVPELMYLAVLPYLGEEVAARELTMPAPAKVHSSDAAQGLNAAERRILEAMLNLVTSKGYDVIEVEQIVREAGVTRGEFDSLFSSKEACAIAVFDQFMDVFSRQVQAAYESEPQWPDSLRAAAYAVASWMTSHPREMRFGATEMLWAGDLAQARRQEAAQNFATMVDAGRSLAAGPDQVPAFAGQRVVASIVEMITDRARTQKAMRPYEFVPELMAVAVRPYLGEEAAARELTYPPPGAGESD
jgi:AcrR family transcriptional regulator